MQGLWSLFKRRIFAVPSSDGLFNQYKERNTEVDLPMAAEIRRKNLHNYFASFQKAPQIVLIGEAPGPWGCRFSGIPFTGERQLINDELPFSGKRSSLSRPRMDIWKKSPYVSNSARLFWRTLRKYHRHFFVWNCIPIHPYKRDKILSVRTPTTEEVLRFAGILAEILAIVNPKEVIAIGKKAEFSLKRLHIPCTYVRHPSQGGAVKFRAGMHRVFARLK